MPQAARLSPMPPPALKKLVVAVHGIGDQSRNETILSTAIRFCDYYRYPGLVPLGAFYQTPPDPALPPPPPAPPLVIHDPPLTAGFTGEIGFAEAHWADIARQLANDGYTLQETKAWARSIVNRIRVPAQRNPANARVDYRRIRLVLEEIIDTVGVVEALLFLSRKAGIFEFDLKKILDDFLGDVQLVTEFEPVRTTIVGRFHSLLAGLQQQHPQAQIHLVAHSEGTVVSFLGLLEACADPVRYPYIHRVRGFMTIGSPIDKHLILWPSLFARFQQPHPAVKTRIRWINYVDYADPVGFNLDTARDWLRDRNHDRIFRFEACDDHSFYRYPLPGKAHVDYWADPEVFGHFIQRVVAPKWPLTRAERKRRREGPPSRRWVPWVTYVAGYVLPFALLHLGVYFLAKAACDYLNPDEHAEHPELWKIVLALSWLIAGTTVWLRLVRLTRTSGWFLLGGAIYALSAAGFWALVGSLDPAVGADGRPRSEFAWFDPLAALAGLPLGAGAFFFSLLVIVTVLLVNLPVWRRR